MTDTEVIVTVKSRANLNDDDEWVQAAIDRDMIGFAKKMVKKYHTVMVMYYKVDSLGEDKRLKIQMDVRMYNILRRYGADLDGFTQGIKLFEENREEFMDKAKRAGWIVEIVDKSDMWKNLFGKESQLPRPKGRIKKFE